MKSTLLSHFTHKIESNGYWMPLCWLRTDESPSISEISVLEAGWVGGLEYVSPTYRPWSWFRLVVWPWLSWGEANQGNYMHGLWVNKTGFEFLLHLFLGCIIFSQQLSLCFSASSFAKCTTTCFAGLLGASGGSCVNRCCDYYHQYAQGHGHVMGPEMDYDIDAIKRPLS